MIVVAVSTKRTTAATSYYQCKYLFIMILVAALELDRSLDEVLRTRLHCCVNVLFTVRPLLFGSRAIVGRVDSDSQLARLDKLGGIASFFFGVSMSVHISGK